MLIFNRKMYPFHQDGTKNRVILIKKPFATYIKRIKLMTHLISQLYAYNLALLREIFSNFGVNIV